MENDSPALTRYSLFPKSIRKSVEALVKPIYKKHGFAEHRILTQWNEIVGTELASYSVPQKLSRPSSKEGGTLHILVASGRALELQHMQPVIIDRIATYFGYKAVSGIRFTQTSSELFRKPKTQKPTQKMQSSEALTKLVENCNDEDLRNALLSLGNAIIPTQQKRD